MIHTRHLPRPRKPHGRSRRFATSKCGLAFALLLSGCALSRFDSAADGDSGSEDTSNTNSQTGSSEDDSSKDAAISATDAESGTAGNGPKTDSGADDSTPAAKDDGVGSDDSAAADDSVGSDDTGSTEPDTQPTLGPNADDTPLDEPDAQSPTSEASDASTSGSSSSMTDTVSSSEPLDGGAGDGPSLTSGSDGGLCSALGLPGCTVTDPVTELPDATLPDECPDVDQSLRGSCGCGFEPSPLCEELAQGLVHRYSFDGTGTTVVDSVGDADGFTVDVELDGSGELDLDGQSAHAQLPAGISSEFQDATFEAWVTWYGGDNNQRILNFGTPDPSDGAPLEYISLTPSSGNTPGLTFAYRTDPDISGISLRAPDPLPESTMQHVTVAFDGSGGTVRLYQGSELLISDTTTDNLQSLADEVNYLGRALYSGYPFLQARIYEFRIYGVALSTEQVQKSDELGPDATISF